MEASGLLRRHAPTIALLLTVVVPLLLGGKPPRPEDCPGGRWVLLGDGCTTDDYWDCVKNAAAQEIAYPRSLLPLAFEKNAGQTDSAYQFISRSSSHSILLSGGNAVLTLGSKVGFSSVRMDLDGTKGRPEYAPEQPLPGLVNYFFGRDPNHWFTNIPSFARVRYRNVYPGIDVVYYGTEGELEHDFIVRPGADPDRIRMRFSGAEVRLEPEGTASILAGQDRITWRSPVIYQEEGGERIPVKGAYKLDPGGRLGFEVSGYDRSKPLIIDPVISFATFVGRSAAEGGSRMASDSAGNAYVAGFTLDAAFPVTPGAISAGPGSGNILVSKLNPSGSAVLFSTYLGGSDTEGALTMALDRDGNLYVASGTSSTDYPTTRGVLKPALRTPTAPNDPFDCVVTKLNASGNAIVYSTYLGGGGRDTCIGIAVDSSGNAYVTGNTGSSNFPVSETAPQRSPRDDREAFVAKLN